MLLQDRVNSQKQNICFKLHVFLAIFVLLMLFSLPDLCRAGASLVSSERPVFSSLIERGCDNNSMAFNASGDLYFIGWNAALEKAEASQLPDGTAQALLQMQDYLPFFGSDATSVIDIDGYGIAFDSQGRVISCILGRADTVGGEITQVGFVRCNPDGSNFETLSLVAGEDFSELGLSIGEEFSVDNNHHPSQMVLTSIGGSETLLFTLWDIPVIFQVSATGGAVTSFHRFSDGFPWHLTLMERQGTRSLVVTNINGHVYRIGLDDGTENVLVAKDQFTGFLGVDSSYGVHFWDIDYEAVSDELYLGVSIWWNDEVSRTLIVISPDGTRMGKILDEEDLTSALEGIRTPQFPGSPLSFGAVAVNPVTVAQGEASLFLGDYWSGLMMVRVDLPLIQSLFFSSLIERGCDNNSMAFNASGDLYFIGWNAALEKAEASQLPDGTAQALLQMQDYLPFFDSDATSVIDIDGYGIAFDSQGRVISCILGRAETLGGEITQVGFVRCNPDGSNFETLSLVAGEDFSELGLSIGEDFSVDNNHHPSQMVLTSIGGAETLLFTLWEIPVIFQVSATGGAVTSFHRLSDGFPWHLTLMERQGTRSLVVTNMNGHVYRIGLDDGTENVLVAKDQFTGFLGVDSSYGVHFWDIDYEAVSDELYLGVSIWWNDEVSRTLIVISPDGTRMGKILDEEDLTSALEGIRTPQFPGSPLSFGAVAVNPVTVAQGEASLFLGDYWSGLMMVRVDLSEAFDEGVMVPITGGRISDNESAAFISFPPGVLDHPTSVHIDTRTKTVTCQIGNQDFRDGERFLGVWEWNPAQYDETGDGLDHRIIGRDGFYSATEPGVVIDLGVNFSILYTHTCPVEDIIEKAELTLGLGDMDTGPLGNQVDSFDLDGIPQPTRSLERRVSNNIAMITSVNVDPGLLDDGVLTVGLALKGPGLEDPIPFSGQTGERDTPSNSAGVDFSRLDMRVRYSASPTTNVIGYSLASEVVYYMLSGSVLSGEGAEIGLPVSGTPYKDIDPSKLSLFKYDNATDSWSNYQIADSIEAKSLASGEVTMFIARGVHHFSMFVVLEANQLGDLDGDGDVDRDDLSIILEARNQHADDQTYGEGNDPRDLDSDGMITALDARKLVLLCTRPRCACE